MPADPAPARPDPALLGPGASCAPRDGGIPADPDAGPAPHSGRPPHTRPGALALVLLGGTVGTACREALTLVIPDAGRVPLALLACNLLGALLLGVLIESLALRGEDTGHRRTLRLLLGTGLLGGFTSYSALSLVLADGMFPSAPTPWTALGYGLLTVIAGGLASALGIALAAATGRRARSAR